MCKVEFFSELFTKYRMRWNEGESHQIHLMKNSTGPDVISFFAKMISNSWKFDRCKLNDFLPSTENMSISTIV